MRAEVLEKWKKVEEEAKRIRQRMADWEFIEKQPPRLKAALKFYVRSGDLRLAQRISGLRFEEFRLLLRKARIPVVV